MSLAKRFLVGLALAAGAAAAGCRGGGGGIEPTSGDGGYQTPWVSGVHHPRTHPGVERAFEEWRWAVLERKYDEIFPRLTPELRAFELATAHGAPLGRGVIPRGERLDPEARLLIGRWVQENRARLLDLSGERPSPLPRPIDESVWLYTVLREEYNRRGEAMASYVEGSEVEGVSMTEQEPDAQVLVRLRDGRRDTYLFLYIDGAWLLDGALSRAR